MIANRIEQSYQICHDTDVNDNVPYFVNGSPYHLNISELTLVGTRIFGNIKAIDKDQPGTLQTWLFPKFTDAFCFDKFWI